MYTPVVISPTLTIKATADPPAGYGVWIDRLGGGLIFVQLEEIGGLVAALTDARAELVADRRGEKYEGDLPF